MIKIIKTAILLIVGSIAILGIDNKMKAKIDIIEEKNKVVKDKIIIAEEVNINIDKKKEQSNLEDKNIIEEQNEEIKNENKISKKNNKKTSKKKSNSINKKETINIGNEDIKYNYSEENNNYQSNFVEDVKIEPGNISNLYEMEESEEQKKGLRLLIDNNVRIDFEN